MKPEGETTHSSLAKQGRILLVGFGVRLLYGVLGIIPVLLLRPDVLSDRPQVVFYSICFYLAVCVAGGLVDASTGRVARLQPLNLHRRSNILSLVFYLLVLLLLWLQRK